MTKRSSEFNVLEFWMTTGSSNNINLLEFGILKFFFFFQDFLIMFWVRIKNNFKNLI